MNHGTYEVEYVALGGWYNSYPGKVTVNASDEEEATFKAKRKAADAGCFSTRDIRIESVKLLFNY